MSSANFNVSKGRIAQTQKDYESAQIPRGTYSVVISDGFYAKQPEVGGRQAGGSKARCADLYFYASKVDAYEESAYLVGKREGQTQQAVAARRARSLGGRPLTLDTHVLGRLNIGCVHGVVNTAGTRMAGSDDDGPDERAQLALDAVEALKPSFQGMVTESFPIADDGSKASSVL